MSGHPDQDECEQANARVRLLKELQNEAAPQTMTPQLSPQAS